jgi:glycosyltransferase involved in cell wall biosynthesis
MNIGFEAKRFFTNYTGLGNYCRFVVGALSTCVPENNYYLYTPKLIANNDVSPIISASNINVITPHPIYRFTRSLWRSWGISRESSLKDLNVFHGLSHELPINLPASLKKIVTVHDLIFFRYPQFYHSIDVAIYKSKLKFACTKADRIIAISDQTKRDLVDFLKIDENKIITIYQGCHPNFRKSVSAEELSSVKIKYKLPHEYILNVGTIEARKNVSILIKALALMPKQLRIPLVVLGRQTNYFNEIVALASKLNVLNEIIFLQNIPFEEFPAIYTGAKIFIYPSLFEGFGIPLVEAIECRVPVITSKGSCFSEAAGPDAIYVDPLNEEELASQISNVLKDERLRDNMISQSYSYISRFKPEIISKHLMEIYTS